MASPNADKKLVPIASPIKGVNTVVNREGQPPDTCWSALNVLPFDRFGRRRVAQRPGTYQVLQYPGTSNFVQNLIAANNITYQSAGFGNNVVVTGQSQVITTAHSSANTNYDLLIPFVGRALVITCPFTITMSGATSSSNNCGITIIDPGGAILCTVAAANQTGSNGQQQSISIGDGGTTPTTQFLVNSATTVSGGTTLSFAGTVTLTLTPTTTGFNVSASSTVGGSVNRTVATFSTDNLYGSAPLYFQTNGTSPTASTSSISAGPFVVTTTTTSGATPVKSAAYNTQLFSVMNGFVYYGSLVAAKASNQSSAVLATNVLVSSARIFNEVYFVDGAHIAQLDIPTLAMVAYASTAGSTPNSTTATQSINLTALSATSSVATATTATAHGINAGASVTISGATPSGFNGTVTVVSVPTATTFTYAVASTVTGSATGTITVVSPYTGNQTTCTLACNWRGRLVLAGDSGSPQNFYMSRAGTPTDWNYGATDSATAVAGNLSLSGLIGEPIVSLIPFTDDIMMIGCTHSIWMLQGDPAAGGTIIPVSQNIGVLGANAWVKDSFDSLYFIGTGGLYKCRPLWEQWQPPQLLTGETFNQFFQDLNPSANIITLMWDEDARYLYMAITPNDDATQGTSLVYDARTEGVWPIQWPQTHGPTAAISFFADGTVGYRGLLLGGYDGVLRKIDATALDDSGTPITSRITLGPIKPFPEAALLSGTTIDFGEADPQSNTWGYPTAITGEAQTPIDGATQDWTLANNPVILDTVQVYHNGLQLINNIDYTIDTSGNLHLFVAPIVGDTLTVNYSYRAAANPVPWNVQVELNAGVDAFQVTEGTPHTSLAINSVIERRQKTFRQRLRGGWFSVTLTNSQPDTYFSFESALLEFHDAGRNRERR